MSQSPEAGSQFLAKALDTCHLLRYHAVLKRGKTFSELPGGVALLSLNLEHAGPSDAVWGSHGSLLLAACGRGVL